MSKIKLTKTELKVQRDALKRFSRFLPTLQLKKQQLQMEVQKVRDEIFQLRDNLEKLKRNSANWSEIFSSPDFKIEEISNLIQINELQIENKNIAGIDVPFFTELTFEKIIFNIFDKPAWFDRILEYIQTLLKISKQEEVMTKRFNLLDTELRVTNQRVNLFEKVKIPEAKENIRKIRIYQGDQETAAVCRSKIAKRKMQEMVI